MKDSKINLNRNYCKDCGICIEYCPQGVFGQDENARTIVAHQDNCIQCNICVYRCPDFALELGGSKE